MKKILSIAVASLAVAAVADTTFSPQIGVNTLTLIRRNSIIPVQFESLDAGTTGGKVTANALVCTNNIPGGSHLYIYQNEAYTAWTLGNNGWVPLDTASTEYVDGISATGVPAENQVLDVGSAIWLSLNGSTSATVSFYGKVASITNSVITKRKINLIANPTSSSVDIIGKIGNQASAGDVIRLVGSVDQIKRNKTNKNWIKYDPDNGVVNVDTLSVPEYTGVWYYSNTNALEDITINWN